ncbi:ribosome 60S biogenesis N-terminal-domain-containing protein [Epithele typhae]|uniref:ribosome 60S biogenesis N-terminal-domain-containing protein n=1 Tax=Epithele typhae TaxID=378194 RepID=UPI002007A852|nr:ribosome 60S biogenesis N-terminal-domain-containing protein [Epithele typhae]KAH9936862.1 ribosome 60S biogenesis N-terminal-domain-containing protein [Epithele typhae]
MPVREQHPPKKRKVEQSSKQSHRYASASEVRRVFKAQSESGLIEGLTALRNQLTIRPDESIVAVNDERLVLAKEWLEEDPGAQELFAIWESTTSRQTSLLAVVVGLLSAVVTLLSTHYSYHSYAQPILRSLLSQQWTQQLNMYVSGQHTELVLVSLKLYNALSNFAGGRERKAVLDAFPWEMKSLPKLLHMRRRTKEGHDADTLARPDIRTLYILLVLSFIDTTTPSSVKAVFLEQHRDAFTSMFKNVWQDSYAVVRRVLEICWSGLWSDHKLKRTLKIQVFSEATLSQLTKIYDRNVPENSDAESIPADVVHHFLLALCSRPGVGLCFQDRGWYSRETEPEVNAAEGSQDGPLKGSKIYNKILANVLKTLRVNEDPRQQELALKILAACPELVAGYWPSAGLALEPRLSSKWLANIALFGAVVSLPVPTASFFLAESGSSSTSLYQPTPPALGAIVDNILPTANIKTHLSRGLQAASPLVQHASALALAKCLLKYERVVQAFQEVERALEEDEEDGLWARRRREVEREVRKRVPDFQVIVGFSQRQNDHQPATDKEGLEQHKATLPNPTRTALLSESAYRLLWLYHRLLPSVVAEARFDAGKLLQAIEEMLSQSAVTSGTGGLDTLRQLHVLRLLKESEHFTWSGKSGSKHSNFHILLKAYIITPTPAVRAVIVALLRHILAPGVLFQHDPDEIALWLECLPRTRRAPGAQSPDGVPLTDEGDAVIAFLDDCVQRCVKTPYKYVEDLQQAAGAGSIGLRPDAAPSPLLATVVEQLGAKLGVQRLAPADALALFAFARKLLVALASKCADLGVVRAYASRMAGLVEGKGVFAEHPSIQKAVEREAELAGAWPERICCAEESEAAPVSPAVQEFLVRVAELPQLDSEDGRKIAAYELVDWLRLVNPKLHPSELARLALAVEKLHPPALQELFQYVDPRQVSIWDAAANVDDFTRIVRCINFNVQSAHCTGSLAGDDSVRVSLTESIFGGRPDDVSIARATRLVLHKLAYCATSGSSRNWLRVLADIMKALIGARIADACQAIVSCLESEVLKGLCSRPQDAVVRKGLDYVLEACFKPEHEDVSRLFSEVTGQWVLLVRSGIENLSEDERETALLWFKYLGAKEASALLDCFADRAQHSSASTTLDFTSEVLHVTADSLLREADVITGALPTFCRLQGFLPQSEELWTLVAAGCSSSLPLAYDGHLPTPFSDDPISSVVPGASKRWSLRLQPIPSLDISGILGSDRLSGVGVDIVTNLLYRQAAARSAVSTWLASPASSSCSTTHLVRIIHAYYDCAHERADDALPSSHLSRVVKVVSEARHPHAVRSMAAECIAAAVVMSPSTRAKYLKLLGKELATVDPEKLTQYSLSVAQRLMEQLGTECAGLAEQMIDLGLKWAVRTLGDKESACTNGSSSSMLSLLGSLIQTKVAVKDHLAEPVIAAVIQDRFSHLEGLRFSRLLVLSTHFKPATANKFLQTVIQHSKFYENCAATTRSAVPSPRDDVIRLLHTLFHLHPSNACQTSHIEPLKRVYGGTLGATDLRILSIFQLFETTRKTSTASLFAKWSPSVDGSSENAFEAIQNLDPSRVLKTCLEFPDARKMTGDDEAPLPMNEALYDPVFVLLLFAQMLSDSAPSSALQWVQFFRTNVASLLMRALSAKDTLMRDVAWAQVAALYRALENADMQEKPHVLHILNLLKDLTSSTPSADEAPRLPAYTTLLLAHAFRALFYPSNFIYPLTARFLLQRPTLDPTDVPMLYGMLYSASDDWKKERAWIVRFLSDGIVGTDEWRILKRRHTWDLLASLFQSEERDRTLRRGVLEVLANVTSHARAAASLVLRHALLAWIEMQLQTLRSEEAIAWARILENVLAVVDAVKMEAATSGEWRVTTGRCLEIILNHQGCTRTVFVAAVPVLLRLSLLPGPALSRLPSLLRASVRRLSEMETDVSVPPPGHISSKFDPTPASTSVRVHRSHRLFEADDAPTIQVWGECTEALWRASMACASKTGEWDALSSRLLVWRAVAGPGGSATGEWARREVVGSLHLG